MILLAEEWKSWKQDKVTKEWFKFLAILEEELKDNWAAGVYVGAVSEETLQRNAAAIGQAELLGRLANATVEEIEESKEYGGKD